MSKQLTFVAIASATSSPAWCGPTRLDSQEVGYREVCTSSCPCQPFSVAAPNAEQKTSAISGQISTGSSASVSLAACWRASCKPGCPCLA